MKSLKIFLLVLIIGASTHFVTIAQSENPYEYWLKEYDAGYLLYEKGKFNEAITRLENALAVINQIDFSTTENTQYYPSENYNFLGICYYNIGEFKVAADNF